MSAGTSPHDAFALIRNEGNEIYRSGDYEGAIKAYSKVLTATDNAELQAACLLNVAACHFQLNRFSESVAQCEVALRALASLP